MPPSCDPQQFRDVLRQSKHIIAIAGAGLSAASGIPTWRDTGGVWTTHDPAALATPAAFAADPVAVWRHYHEMREQHVAVLAAEPNPAHYALSLLCLPSYLATLAPAAQFTLVTQNIDGLSTRALQKTVAQSRAAAPDAPAAVGGGPRVFEMHGRVLDTLCTACGRLEHNGASLLCPALARPSSGDPAAQVAVEELPHCVQCGGLLRPGVVWFDELPRHSREIWAAVDEADLCLVIGTSATPAVAYVHEVAEHGGKVAVFNTQRSDDDAGRDLFFLGPCEETLPRTLFDIAVSP